MRLPLMRIIVMLSVLPGFSLAFGAEPATQPQRPLRFVPREGKQDWPVSDAIRNDPATIHPHFAAILVIRSDERMKSMSGILRQPNVQQEMSEQQQVFLRQEIATLGTENGGTAIDDGVLSNYARFILFAVSEEDARKETLAVLAHLERQGKLAREKASKALAEKEASLAALDEKIQEMSEQRMKVAEQLESLATRRGYAATVDELRQSLREAHSQEQALAVEHAGQLARNRAIQSNINQELSRAEQPAAGDRGIASRPVIAVPREVLTSLQTMLVQLNIEMAGTAARQEALRKQIADDRLYLDLLQQDQRLNSELLDQGRARQKLSEQIDSDKKTLTDPPSGMLPPKIFDNVVYIVKLAPSEPATQPAR